METKAALFFLALMWSSLVFGQGKARYSGEVMAYPVGTRANGMGTAFVSVANDGSAFHWNPAGVALTDGRLISAEYSTLFGTFSEPLGSFYHTGLQFKLEKLGAVAVNWVRLGVDEIPKLEYAGNDPGTRKDYSVYSLDNRSFFSNTDDAIYVTFSREFTPVVDFGWQYFKVPYRIPIGLNVKYLRQSFSEPVNATSSGLGLDAGVLLITDINDYSSKKVWGEFRLGFVAKDLTNTLITWSNNTQYSVPASYQWGASYTQPVDAWESDFTFSYQSNYGYEHTVAYGFEYRYDRSYSLRTGLNGEEFTIGIGLFLFNRLSLDYAFQTHELGNPHRIGLSFNLDSQK